MHFILERLRNLMEVVKVTCCEVSQNAKLATMATVYSKVFLPSLHLVGGPRWCLYIYTEILDKNNNVY